MVYEEATAPCILDAGNLEELACPVADCYERARICFLECQLHIKLIVIMSPTSTPLHNQVIWNQVKTAAVLPDIFCGSQLASGHHAWLKRKLQYSVVVTDREYLITWRSNILYYQKIVYTKALKMPPPPP
ncbi:uncharacterized protein CLUP02_00943 [Colletotrichum lupini]|uniref:Uncharacterized protein n=1 Tax=Colletotrichum lupini TaxID=145971 RepID=A0A9Q8SBS5_9PEZI|nr:uncharacterized protein CLUP02_00943 [Colletotrichum lupini]UQC74295.1 hypothetical protein CLUP02_00943 [Colletotrichum lupini]